MTREERRQKFNLINLGYNPWGPFWKRNQTIFWLLSRAEYIDKALFINPPVWTSELFRKPRVQLTRPHLDCWRAIFTRRAHRKATVFTPLLLPFRGKSKALRRTENVLINRLLESFIESPFILMINNPNTAIKHIASRLIKKASLTVFDWSDDFEQFTSDTREQRSVQEQVSFYIRQSHIVTTINHSLTLRAKRMNPNSYTIRNGTGFFLFPQQELSHSLPTRLRELNRPIVGYIGWLNSSRLDDQILRHLAERRPTWNFVFIGPKSSENPLGSSLPNFPNVHILDPVPFRLVAPILKRFDVCILPNKINPHTEGNDPIKVYDYLASGKPIVATNTAGIEDFKEVVRIASDKTEFLRMLDDAVNENDMTLVQRRQAVGLENSWQQRFQEFQNLLRWHLLDRRTR